MSVNTIQNSFSAVPLLSAADISGLPTGFLLSPSLTPSLPSLAILHHQSSFSALSSPVHNNNKPMIAGAFNSWSGSDCPATSSFHPLSAIRRALFHLSPVSSSSSRPLPSLLLQHERFKPTTRTSMPALPFIAFSPSSRSSSSSSPSSTVLSTTPPPPPQQQQHHHHLETVPSFFPWRDMAAGAGSGAVAAAVTCPLDVIKTRIQVAATSGVHPNSHPYRGFIRTAKYIAKVDGLGAFYRGFTPTIVALVPNWAIYWTAYRGMKLVIGPSLGDGVLNHLTASVAAGGVTLIATNPLWVVKTRLSSGSKEHRHNTFVALYRLLKHEGLHGALKGIIPSLFGLTHVAVQFTIYEALKKHARSKLPPEADGHLPMLTIMATSGFAKAIASSATYPHEIIRAQQQHMIGPHPSTNDAVRSLYRSHGIRGFYSGLGVNLVRVVPAGAITFVTYEWLMQEVFNVET